MINILILFASPHKDGKTNELLNVYLKQYLQNLNDSFEIEVISIYNQKILPCVGCNICIKNNVCPQNTKDDVEKIFDYIQKSNHVVVASPVYFSGFPSTMKALIDRSQQLYSKKINSGKMKNLKIRTGALVATCGSKNKNNIVSLIDGCKQFFDCLDIAFSDKLYATNTDNLNDIRIYNEN